MSDVPTIQERYARAIRSSHLEVEPHRAGDIDTVMAAGWCKDDLGASLFRLVCEFDRVRADYWAANARLREQEAQATREEKSTKVGPTRADLIRRSAADEAIQARAFILLELKTLGIATRMLGEHAITLRDRYRFDLDDRAVRVLAGKVMDVFLDPTCPHCTGRGKVGSMERGEREHICRPCEGTGRRDREAIGRTPAQRQFAGRLLSDMELSIANVDYAMQKVLR